MRLSRKGSMFLFSSSLLNYIPLKMLLIDLYVISSWPFFITGCHLCTRSMLWFARMGVFQAFYYDLCCWCHPNAFLWFIVYWIERGKGWSMILGFWWIWLSWLCCVFFGFVFLQPRSDSLIKKGVMHTYVHIHCMTGGENGEKNVYVFLRTKKKTR